MVEYILKNALENKRTVSIMYMGKNGITQRDIELYSMNGTRVKAYCHLRKQYRIFDLSNILAADFVRPTIKH